MSLSVSLIDSSIESLFFIVSRSVIYAFKGYLAFYILCCCHEVLEDHREGTVNAREKFTNALISTLILALTFVGLYGIFTSHFGLFLTWLLLKPVIRIFELESTMWSALAMSVIASGWTLCFFTYESFKNSYSFFAFWKLLAPSSKLIVNILLLFVI